MIVNYNGSAARAEEVVKEIEEAGGKAEAVQCNVSEFAKSAELMDYGSEKIRPRGYSCKQCRNYQRPSSDEDE
mgnify:CR=1 FL=1